MSAAPKASGFSFGFSKKADPKRVVEALQEKKVDDRVAITSLEEGTVQVDGAVEEAKKFTIPCKNPLENIRALTPKPVDGTKAARKVIDTDELPAGLVVNANLSKLSKEDAEAARELLHDAISGSAVDDGPPTKVQPILMRPGAKRARTGEAPDATKSMFEAVPVESFGEALLRGMGYDPEQNKTKYVYHDKPRDNLLGLGAKALLPDEKVAAKKKAATAKAAAEKKADAENASTTALPASGVDPVSLASRGGVEAQEGREVADGPPHEKRRKCEEVWASRGLVVRVISKERQLKPFFGGEAVILEVEESGRCRIKARPVADPDAKSQTISGVLISDLETRVSRDCKEVRILRGLHRGSKAELLRRDPKRGTSVVRLKAGGLELELPLDDVCQFVA